eukprot:74629-Pleurochrysis_carterae.AAC.1
MLAHRRRQTANASGVGHPLGGCASGKCLRGRNGQAAAGVNSGSTPRSRDKAATAPQDTLALGRRRSHALRRSVRAKLLGGGAREAAAFGPLWRQEHV